MQHDVSLEAPRMMVAGLVPAEGRLTVVVLLNMPTVPWSFHTMKHRPGLQRSSLHVARGGRVSFRSASLSGLVREMC